MSKFKPSFNRLTPIYHLFSILYIFNFKFALKRDRTVNLFLPKRDNTKFCSASCIICGIVVPSTTIHHSVHLYTFARVYSIVNAIKARCILLREFWETILPTGWLTKWNARICFRFSLTCFRCDATFIKFVSL